MEMGEEEAKKVGGEEDASEPATEAAAEASETTKDVTVEKTVIAPQDEKADDDDSKALAFVESKKPLPRTSCDQLRTSF